MSKSIFLDGELKTPLNLAETFWKCDAKILPSTFIFNSRNVAGKKTLLGIISCSKLAGSHLLKVVCFCRRARQRDLIASTILLKL